MRILALLPDAFGGHGGIALYNRDLLTALCADARVEAVTACVRWMPNPPNEALPAKLTYQTAGVAGWMRYAGNALLTGLVHGRFDLVICGHLHLVPLAGVAARLLGAPAVLWIHGIEAWQPSDRWLANRMLSRMRAVVAVSDHTRRRFLSWSGLRPERVLLLPNAIHQARFGPGRKHAGLAKRYGLAGRTVLLTLGRLAAHEPGKGFDQVMELLPRLSRRIPDVVYVIAGDGDDRARLERKAHRLGVDNRVVFTGAVPEQDKADLYRLADVYVMPSRGEGFGFVFLEAMACGVPVVASRVDGSREAVRGGELGLLVDPSSLAEIEAAVLQALSLPRQVPKGLEYFAFERFRERLGGILDSLPRADR